MQVFRDWSNGQGSVYSPRLLIALIEHLPPDSATAMAVNGSDWAGWDRHAFMLADMYDAINMNTIATGNWRKKPPKLKPYPRPRTTNTIQSGKQAVARFKNAFGRG